MEKNCKKKKSTHWAFEWFFARMTTFVDLQLATAEKTVATKIAQIFLLALVDQHMRIQCVLCHVFRAALLTCIATHRTAFRFIMQSQLVWLSELGTTIGAHHKFSILAIMLLVDMTFVVCVAWKFLFANKAFERLHEKWKKKNANSSLVDWQMGYGKIKCKYLTYFMQCFLVKQAFSVGNKTQITIRTCKSTWCNVA